MREGRGGRAHLPKVGAEKSQHKQASGTSPLLPEGGLLAGIGRVRHGVGFEMGCGVGWETKLGRW